MDTARVASIGWPPLRRDFVTSLLVSGLAAFGAVVLLLLVRRMAGALVQPLGGLPLVGVAALSMALAAGWRLGWQARCRRQSPWDLMVPVLPGFALFMLLCVLSLPGTKSWGLMLTWLAFFTSEAAWWWAAYSANKEPTGRPIPSQTLVAEPAAELRVGSGPEILPSDVFQQITRYRDGEQERIAVLLRPAFAIGQRVAVAHISFCPPLGGIPDLAAEATEGPDATVTITNVQTFGLRLEIRLEEPADERCDVMVELAGPVVNVCNGY